MIQVRRMSRDECIQLEARVVELVAQLRSGSNHVEQSLIHATFLDHRTYIVGAFIKGMLVGIALGNEKLHFTGKELYVDDLVVHNEFRNQGIATQLMDAIEAYAMDCGCKRVLLTCSREIAQEFYEQRGYITRTRAFSKVL